MKKYLLILIVIISVSFNKSPKERYFFVGYAATDGSYGGCTITTNDGHFITFAQAKKDVTDFSKIKGKVSITSIYEFTSKADFDSFNKGFK